MRCVTGESLIGVVAGVNIQCYGSLLRGFCAIRDFQERCNGRGTAGFWFTRLLEKLMRVCHYFVKFALI